MRIEHGGWDFIVEGNVAGELHQPLNYAAVWSSLELTNIQKITFYENKGHEHEQFTILMGDVVWLVLTATTMGEDDLGVVDTNMQSSVAFLGEQKKWDIQANAKIILG